MISDQVFFSRRVPNRPRGRDAQFSPEETFLGDPVAQNDTLRQSGMVTQATTHMAVSKDRGRWQNNGVSSSFPSNMTIKPASLEGIHGIPMYTLWWTNIAIENGHRNSGFSH